MRYAGEKPVQVDTGTEISMVHLAGVLVKGAGMLGRINMGKNILTDGLADGTVNANRGNYKGGEWYGDHPDGTLDSAIDTGAYNPDDYYFRSHGRNY